MHRHPIYEQSYGFWFDYSAPQNLAREQLEQIKLSQLKEAHIHSVTDGDHSISYLGHNTIIRNTIKLYKSLYSVNNTFISNDKRFMHKNSICFSNRSSIISETKGISSIYVVLSIILNILWMKVDGTLIETSESLENYFVYEIKIFIQITS